MSADQTAASATIDNLKAAFAGESQANRRYIAFAAAADRSQMPQIAKLFRAAAEAETVHALMHLRALGWPKSIIDNLQAALDGENYEFTSMYPKFLEQARADGNKQAANGFDLANKVEEIHFALYSKAMEAAKDGKDMAAGAIHVCTVCGNTVLGDAPDKCPVCGSPRAKFHEVK